MQRYAEMIAGTARKFYQVEVEGQTWIARWGRIGTTGQSKTYWEVTEARARRRAADQFAAKLQKGYTEKTPLEVLASAFDHDREVPVLFRPESYGSDEPALRTACAKLDRIVADKERASYPLLEGQAVTVVKSLAQALLKAVGREEANRILTLVAIDFGRHIYIPRFPFV